MRLLICLHAMRRALVLLPLVWCGNALAQAEPHFEAELIFRLDDQHNHAPSIVELPSGDLLVSWYRGSGERKADDVAVWGAVRRAATSQWSEPFLMADTPGFPDCNTAMMVDARGRVWLFWPVIIANSWESCLTCYRVGEVAAESASVQWHWQGNILLKPEDFSAPAAAQLDALEERFAGQLTDALRDEITTLRQRLPDKLYQRLGWQPRCKPTVLPSGRILLPLYTDTFSISIMAISDDQGRTWHASSPLLGFGAIQPTVLRRRDGTLVAYMRENGVTGRIRVAESVDDGQTWGPVGTTDLPNPGSGLDGVRLRDGRWVLVYNDTTEGRHSLAISLSPDEGRTWGPTRHLERHDGGAFHYPAVIEAADGTLHVVYSYFVDGGKSIKHVRLDPAWITH
ncbi:MAG: hypothetical protein KatS3mg111_3036 [Pirellulaceae bacterium]|nr:MAG: hypothetical protein KatS3mg111_3036 [Pirellulaceae bacterium]